MARANRRGGFGVLRGATNNRSGISDNAPNNPQNLDRWVDKTTGQEYYWDKPSTTWIPLLSTGGLGAVGGLVYHNDTNTTAVSTNVEVATVDVTLDYDGAIVVTGTFVGTASAAMTITSLIKLDTVTQHTEVQYISGAVDDTISFSVVLEGIEAGDYTVSVDMSADTGTFTLDASEQHLYCLTYYDVVTPTVPPSIPTTFYSLVGIDASSNALGDLDLYIPDSWTAKTNIPSPNRFNNTSEILNGKAYSFYGNNGSSKILDNDEYIPDTWASKTDGLTPTRSNLSSAEISNKAYILCGNSTGALSDNDEYVVDSWSSKTSAPSPARADTASEGINGNAYLCYGNNGSSTRYTDNDAYNQSGDSWSAKTNGIGVARANLNSGKADSRLFFAGGFDVSRLQDMEEYNYASDSWSSKSDMPLPGRSDLAMGNSNDDIYISGGFGPSGRILDTDKYMLGSNSWASVADLPSPARSDNNGFSL